MHVLIFIILGSAGGRKITLLFRRRRSNQKEKIMTGKKSTPCASHRSARGQFKKDSSGNPKGRPKGSLNKATILAEQLLDGEAEEITRKCIELAKDGDRTALKLVMERFLPRRRGRPIQLDLPNIKTTTDLDKAYDIVLQAIGEDNISPDQATKVLQLLVGKLEVAKDCKFDDVWPFGENPFSASNEKPTT